MRGRLFTILTWCLGLCMGAAAATAQTSFLNLLEPPIARDDFDRMAQILVLEDSQRRSAESLFEGYLASHAREADRLNDLYTKRTEAVHAKADDAPNRLADLVSGMGQFWRVKQREEHQLMADLRALLTPEQLANSWPAAERLQRRKWLRYVAPVAASQWYRVDLVRCLADAKLDAPSKAAMDDTLLEYELALDAQLQRYGRLNWSKTGDLLTPSDDDTIRVTQEIGRATAALNRKYARLLAEHPAPGQAAKFTDAVHRQAYWWVSELFTREERSALTRAQALADLTDLQRARLGEITTRWSTDTDRFRRWAQEQFDLLDAEFERTTEEKVVAKVQASPPGKDPFSLVWDPIYSRYVEMETKLVTDLRAALNEDQRRAVWPAGDKAMQR